MFSDFSLNTGILEDLSNAFKLSHQVVSILLDRSVEGAETDDGSSFRKRSIVALENVDVLEYGTGVGVDGDGVDYSECRGRKEKSGNESG